MGVQRVKQNECGVKPDDNNSSFSGASRINQTLEQTSTESTNTSGSAYAENGLFESDKSESYTKSESSGTTPHSTLHTPHSIAAHPLCAAAYFLSVLLIVSFSNNPIFTAAAFAGAVVSYILCKREVRTGTALTQTSTLWLALVLVPVIALTNPLFSHKGNTVLFFLNGLPITLESFFYGVNLGFKAAAVLLWCAALSRVLTSEKITYLLGGISPQLALVLSMSLRFIPQYIREYKSIRAAQRAMGLSAQDNVVDTVRCAVADFSALVTYALENSVDTAASMKARGYGCAHRTSFTLYRFTVRDGVLLAAIAVLSTAAAVALGSGAADFSFYPLLSELPVGVGAVVGYTAYALLVGLLIVN